MKTEDIAVYPETSRYVEDDFNTIATFIPDRIARQWRHLATERIPFVKDIIQEMGGDVAISTHMHPERNGTVVIVRRLLDEAVW